MKYEYIGEQSITLHGIGEAGARMRVLHRSYFKRLEALCAMMWRVDPPGKPARGPSRIRRPRLCASFRP